MFKKPFNRKVGEERQCKECNTLFHAKKPVWRCQKCVNKAQKVIEEKKRAKYPKKETYPFNNRTNEAGSRFCSIRTALSNAWKEYNKTGDKSYVNAHYDKQLKEIKDNGILEWILDRRTPEAKREMNPNAKTRNMIRIDYPDTRGHYEE
jgi:hypothetical protein